MQNESLSRISTPLNSFLLTYKREVYASHQAGRLTIWLAELIAGYSEIPKVSVGPQPFIKSLLAIKQKIDAYLETERSTKPVQREGESEDEFQKRAMAYINYILGNTAPSN